MNTCLTRMQTFVARSAARAALSSPSVYVGDLARKVSKEELSVSFSKVRTRGGWVGVIYPYQFF